MKGVTVATSMTSILVVYIEYVEEKLFVELSGVLWLFSQSLWGVCGDLWGYPWSLDLLGTPVGTYLGRSGPRINHKFPKERYRRVEKSAKRAQEAPRILGSCQKTQETLNDAAEATETN